MDYKMDSTGDVDMTNNEVSWVIDADSIRQHLLIRLQFFFGEWFADTRLGVPFYEQILVKGVPLATVTSIIRKVVITTPGVTEVISLTIDEFESRSLTVSFQCRISTGEVLVFENVELVI